MGHVLPNFCLFGQTLTKAEFLTDVCVAGKILMPEQFKKKLPPKFRYSNPDQSTIQNLHGQQCFVLDAKQEHIVPSIAPVLRAYSKFRTVKNHEVIDEMPITLSSETITLPSVEDEVFTGMTGNFTLCIPRNSKICNIL